MTATVLAFRTELQLPSPSAPGNPDLVMVLPDFPSEQQALAWSEMVVDSLATEQGPFTAQAARRLANQQAGELTVNEDDVAGILVRAVATVQRPSGRVAGVALVHLSMHAERVTTPEASYARLRVGLPVVHTAGLAVQTEVLEAALMNLLDQAEAAADALVQEVRREASDCVVWNLPVRFGDGELLQELNLRLIERFYASSLDEETMLAA
ncbi:MULTISPECIES: hypothetical protein [unclassified Variovorax]|uniref:hypothetical protein n=1 Tax=unclassified Variovorax TaxID=663243 RepID=UPI0013169F35|nr:MULTISPECIES: hypothetical protein [unclassified Variovorax]VTU42066.1 hypothetical protein H6P1_00102 [Variovorax sp. PBL-H6]VTU44279.1 hypothetical protein SRS16P1_00800 [Variovorax sp. SRS16]VTU44355.1 hypothetical protein E5P1_00793 [Variovorax sp. PBL-E5]